MRGIERLAELGGDNFLRALTPGPPLRLLRRNGEEEWPPCFLRETPNDH